MSNNIASTMSEEIEAAAEANPKSPANPPVPAKQPVKGNAPTPPVEEKETERARYSSPPCMMGELDEILKE